MRTDDRTDKTKVTGASCHYAKTPKESVIITRTKKVNYMWVNSQHSVVWNTYTRFERNEEFLNVPARGTVTSRL